MRNLNLFVKTALFLLSFSLFYTSYAYSSPGPAGSGIHCLSSIPSPFGKMASRIPLIRKHPKGSIGGLSLVESNPISPTKRDVTGTFSLLMIRTDFIQDTDAKTTGDGKFLSSSDTAFFKALADSVAGFYFQSSHGKMSLSITIPDTIYTMPDTMGRYGDPNDGGNGFFSAYKLLTDAVQAADSDYNFCGFDIILIAHAGFSAQFDTLSNTPNDIPNITPGFSQFGGFTTPVVTNDGCTVDFGSILAESNQQDSHPNEGVLGDYVHEIGHNFFLPDLIDFDNSTAGVGKWDLMGFGPRTANSRYPSDYGAWSKVFLNWITPEQIKQDTISFRLSAVEDTPQILLLPSHPDDTGEYFLLEVRRHSGNDTFLPGEGLMIWRVNEDSFYPNSLNPAIPAVPNSQPVDNDKFPSLNILEADGLFQMDTKAANGGNTGDAGDPYYFPAQTKFDASTSPASLSFDGSTVAIAIRNISGTGTQMYFDVNLLFKPPAEETITLLVETIEKGLKLEWKGNDSATFQSYQIFLDSSPLTNLLNLTAIKIILNQHETSFILSNDILSSVLSGAAGYLGVLYTDTFNEQAMLSETGPFAIPDIGAPRPAINFKTINQGGGIIKFTWTRSPSDSIVDYRLYWNGTNPLSGIDFSSPIAILSSDSYGLQFETTITGVPLNSEITFVLHTKNTETEEFGENTAIALTASSSLDNCRPELLSPYAGSIRGGRQVSVLAQFVNSSSCKPSDITGMTFEYKLLGSAKGWTKAVASTSGFLNPDPDPPWAFSWNTAILAKGNYFIRSVAAKTSGGTVASSAVSVVIDTSLSPTITEGIGTTGHPEASFQVFRSTGGDFSIVGNQGSASDQLEHAARVKILSGTLNQDSDFLTIRVLSDSGVPTLPSTLTPSGEVHEIILKSGQSQFDTPLQITLNYQDLIGFLLNTTIKEDSIQVFTFDTSSGNWVEVSGIIRDTEANTISFSSSHLSIFGLFEGPVTASSISPASSTLRVAGSNLCILSRSMPSSSLPGLRIWRDKGLKNSGVFSRWLIQEYYRPKTLFFALFFFFIFCSVSQIARKK